MSNTFDHFSALFASNPLIVRSVLDRFLEQIRSKMKPLMNTILSLSISFALLSIGSVIFIAAYKLCAEDNSIPIEKCAYFFDEEARP